MHDAVNVASSDYGGSNPSRPTVNVVNEETEQADCSACVGMRKPERCTSLSGAKGEYREVGLREIFVRKFTCDRILSYCNSRRDSSVVEQLHGKE